VGDGVWRGVFDADAGDAYVACFAGFAEGVVAAVEVFALLTLLLFCMLVDCGGDRERGGASTLSLFCSRFFLSGSLPYMRNRRCSSGDMACGDMMSRGVHTAAEGDLTLMSTLLFWWGFMMGAGLSQRCFRPLLLFWR
jgi:hypothetical protein